MNPKIQDYSEKLRSYLHPLPSAEQDEITQEIESHLLEGIQHGKPIDELIVKLGEPKELAKGYVGEYYLKQKSTRPSFLFRKTVFFATTSMTSPVVTVFLGGVSFSFAIAAIAILLAGLMHTFGASIPFQFGPYEVPRFLSLIVALGFAALAGKVSVYFYKKLQIYFQSVQKRYRRLFLAKSHPSASSKAQES
ncbi:DUF1700 domain-containing protein [Laceyella putida]|uniref:DUF1700 domain-containing protein n=1 Tax=Laceyella putida TaxID=110101 RepID=A0ABW2RIV5_9BACL